MGFALKLAVVFATVLSTVVMFITDFAISDLPTICTSLTSWFKPPYLYVVINFIIITIAASSRLQSTEPAKVVLPVELPPTQEPEVLFHVGYISDMKQVQAIEPEFSANSQFSNEFVHHDQEGYEEIEENIVTKSVISVSAWKPPASAGFRRRKRAKTMPEGGRSTSRVSRKPKRQETLESTWKAITEGRSSDTWESDNSNRMTKPPSPEQLSKEPSLEQEELNRRVEAFINKVNQNMRLQRQESLDQMIKRGAY